MSPVPAEHKSSFTVHSAPHEGRLVLTEPGMYAVFQTSLPRQESYLADGLQWYTYGRITANGWRLSRGDDPRHGLLPHGRYDIDVQLRQSLLVLPEEVVGQALTRLTQLPPPRNGYEPSLSAEKLYQAVAGRHIGGVAIEACGTYRQGERGGELVIVDDQGGYCFGLESRAGSGTEEQLSNLLQATSVPAS